jgi:hypothetical protein
VKIEHFLLAIGCVASRKYIFTICLVRLTASKRKSGQDDSLYNQMVVMFVAACN